MASQMANYIYVVIDARDGARGAAVLIDACWDVDGILRFCSEDLKVERVAAALYTHRHFDHTGGTLPRFLAGGRKVTVPGLRTLLERGVPVAVGAEDVAAVAKQSGVGADAIRALCEGDAVPVGPAGGGGAVISVLCTPGHTTGSVSLHLQAGGCGASFSTPSAEAPSVLFTGDTLFIGSCGRCDLPESDFGAMLASLERLSRLPSRTLVLPGHNYAAPAHTTIGAERLANDLMIQAMNAASSRGGGGGSGPLSPSRTAAALPLPDYLAVAARLLPLAAGAERARL